jgi:hypothetical protein
MWDSGRDCHPAGCEVSREALQQESSPRIAVGRKPLTEESSCEAEHMAAPTDPANVKKALANSEPSTHGSRPDVLVLRAEVSC